MDIMTCIAIALYVLGGAYLAMVNFDHMNKEDISLLDTIGVFFLWPLLIAGTLLILAYRRSTKGSE